MIILNAEKNYLRDIEALAEISRKYNFV